MQVHNGLQHESHQAAVNVHLAWAAARATAGSLRTIWPALRVPNAYKLMQVESWGSTYVVQIIAAAHRTAAWGQGGQAHRPLLSERTV
jgi:hypothetical protein